jgi:phosphomevalonate decarboxylase
MKATAVAHPIQGLLKYHGFRDPDRNVPAHDSISVCTAPSRTTTTVAFDRESDSVTVDGAPIDEEGRARAREVLDLVRERAGIQAGARVVSENTFPPNVGLGASASAFAALAKAATAAADLDPPQMELSRLARRGAASAARSVVGGFAHLRSTDAAPRAVAEPIPSGFDDDLRIVIASLPERKYTSRAHASTPDSPHYGARLAGVHETAADLRTAIRTGDVAGTFSIAERESIELLGVTMTGSERWLYWRPETLGVLETARELRTEGVPVYFSADTGATAYLNTTAEHVSRVRDAIEGAGIDTEVWRVGGGVRETDEHLF